MKQITKKPVVTFKVGDRVQFHRSVSDRGSMSVYTGTTYGIVIKMNKVTAIVKTQTAEWNMNID